MAGETRTFKEAYGVLQEHAETLRNQTEPNIDDLLAIVEESVSAYKVCKERIDAVEKALQKALTDVATDAPPRAASEEGATRLATAAHAPRAAAAPAPASASAAQNPQTGGFDDMDDDIPF
jgi:exodeoxyribonuclease VII small subunit